MTKVCLGFLQEHDGVFSGSYTSHIPVLPPIPETPYLTLMSAAPKASRKAPLAGNENRLGKSPGRGVNALRRALASGTPAQAAPVINR